MSTFEDYDTTSHHYDQTRIPVGTEIILGCLARLSPPMSELTLLDAGCGTGAYSEAVIRHVGQIEALDMSTGMLTAARQKLAPDAGAGRIRFHQGSIMELPFGAGQFDAVMINQVAHHLGDNLEQGFAGLRRVIGEFARVLRPGGGLVFNHCSQEQLRDAYWYAALIPEANERMRNRFAPLDHLTSIFEEAGFVAQGSFVPVDAICQGPAYFDGLGPLSETWRAGDSMWALVSREELEAAEARVRGLEEARQLTEFVAEHDQRRPAIGQITILFATREDHSA